jgi:hypothetical protein
MAPWGSCRLADGEDYAVHRDQQGEPGQAENPGEDDVGEPMVAEEDPAETHCRRPGDGQDDAQGDGEVAAEPAGNEIGHHPSNDGAVQRVTVESRSKSQVDHETPAALADVGLMRYPKSRSCALEGSALSDEGAEEGVFAA